MIPLFSVILPTYNRADLLPSAIDSLIAQEFQDFEVIVVDDGSIDDTSGVLARYTTALEGRLRVLRQANAGQGAARNRGIAEARGEYCAFLDSDDLLFPWSLAVIAEAIEINGRPPIVLGKEFRFKNTEGFDGLRLPLQTTSWPDLYAFGLVEQLRGAGETVVRTELLRQVGGFATERVMGEDSDLLLQLGVVPHVVKIQSPHTYGYRMHGGMFSSSVGVYQGVSRLVRRYRAGAFPGGHERGRDAAKVIARFAVYCCLKCVVNGQRWLGLKMYLKTCDIQFRAGPISFLSRTAVRMLLGALGWWPLREKNRKTLLAERA